MKNVTFVLDKFPTLSETFILNQISMFIENGYSVKIIRMYKDLSGVKHPWVEKFQLEEKTKTVFNSTKRHFKLFSLIKAIFSDFINFNFKSIDLFLNGMFTEYMLHKKIYDVDGIVICHFGPVGAKVANLIEKNLLKDVMLATVFHGADMSIHSVLAKHKNDYLTLFDNGTIMLPISDYWRKDLIKLGCPKEKIHVHRMGVDLRDFQFRERYINPSVNEIVKLICVCRFVEKKGLSTLLYSMHLLSNNYSLTLVGDGPLMSDVKLLIKTLKLEERVKLTGACTSSEVARLLSDSHGFVLPSITAENGDKEGIPVALMEAMASGILVFSSYHSGIPELIVHGENGFLSDEKNSQQLKDNIQYAFESIDDESRNKIAIKARNTIDTNFNIIKLNKKLISLTSL